MRYVYVCNVVVGAGSKDPTALLTKNFYQPPLEINAKYVTGRSTKF